MAARDEPYYRGALARIHHEGFAFHADDVAPGIVALLEPVRQRRGLVLELGCGSGLLTRHLVDAGLRVLATDASPDMLALAAAHAAGAEGFERITMPDDPLPPADAVVAVGHPLSYLPDETALHRALIAAARSLRPGGMLAVDVCDLAYGVARAGVATHLWQGEGWFLANRSSVPAPDRFVRDMVTFVEEPDGRWRRDDEVHHNVLVDTSVLPALLAAEGVTARVGRSFGDEVLPEGLMTVTGTKAGVVSGDRSSAAD